ncbi:DUF6541 family protein [Brachybacterium sp. GCM10030267]|uniref:DUF6541 family protein n=1 Tax=unclassified Brachybacterium TaxID=2623841 RepID=UPI0036066E52
MTELLPVLAAWALLAVPGHLLLIALASRVPVRWGWAPVVTVLLTVVLTALYRLLGIPWTILSAVIGYLALVGLALLARLLIARRLAHPPPGDPASSAAPWTLRSVSLVTGVAVLSGVLVVASSSQRMGGIGTLNGSYDSFFHLSAIAFIRDGGDAFLTTALTEIYGAPTYYPVMFDALAALLPFDTVTAANAMMLSLLAALPSSVAALAASVAAGRREAPVGAALAAAASTLFLSVAATALVMGLWPTVLGVVCLPVAIASALRLLEHRHGVRGLRRLGGLTGHAAVLVGTAVAHPSMLFSVAVVAGLYVLVGGIGHLRAGRGRRGWWQVGGALAAAGGFLVVSSTMLSGMNLTKPSADGVGSVAWKILTDTPRIPVVETAAWPLLPVWILAAIGAVAAVRRWEVVGTSSAVAVVASVLLGLATEIESPAAAALVNPWYGARERIAPLMMCMLMVLLVRGLDAVVDVDRIRGRPVFGTVAAVGVLAIVLVAVVVPPRLPLLGSLAYTAYGLQLEPYVTPQERAFIERTAAALPDSAVVLADPLDGAPLYWSIGGTRTVYPTMARPLTRDQTLVANYAGNPDIYGEVCSALTRLGPTHLYRDVSAASGAAINPEASRRWSGVHDIPPSRLTLVAEEGPYALYELEPVC